MNSLEQLSLVTFEQAKKLKEHGFNWEVNDPYFEGGIVEENYAFKVGANSNDYNTDGWSEEGIVCSAPTVALALQFYREEKGFQYGVCPNIREDHPYLRSDGTYEFFYYTESSNVFSCGGYSSYPEAESALLDKIQKLIDKQ